MDEEFFRTSFLKKIKSDRYSREMFSMAFIIRVYALVSK